MPSAICGPPGPPPAAGAPSAGGRFMDARLGEPPRAMLATAAPTRSSDISTRNGTLRAPTTCTSTSQRDTWIAMGVRALTLGCSARRGGGSSMIGAGSSTWKYSVSATADAVVIFDRLTRLSRDKDVCELRTFCKNAEIFVLLAELFSSKSSPSNSGSSASAPMACSSDPISDGSVAPSPPSPSAPPAAPGASSALSRPLYSSEARISSSDSGIGPVNRCGCEVATWTGLGLVRFKGD